MADVKFATAKKNIIVCIILLLDTIIKNAFISPKYE